MSKLDITKQVPLSNQLYSRVEVRINELGIKFPEYIRHLILLDTSNMAGRVEYLTKADEKGIGESLRDLSEKRYTRLNTVKEVDTHFKELAKKANE